MSRMQLPPAGHGYRAKHGPTTPPPPPTIRPLNRECQQGKHHNCDWQAIHPDDTIGPCDCRCHTSNGEG